MGLMSKLKNIITYIIYKGPKEYKQFELLEGKEEKTGKGQEGKKKDKFVDLFDSQGRTRARHHKRQNKSTEIVVSKKLKKNLAVLKSEFNYPLNQDIIIREFKVMGEINGFITYIDGMVKDSFISSSILRQLMRDPRGKVSNKNGVKEDIAQYILNNIVSGDKVSTETKYKRIIKQILGGSTALFVEGCEKCILVDSRGFEKRGVTTPLSEPVIKGSQEAYIEDLRTNVTLVRKIIRNKNLVTEILETGKTNNTECSVLYMKNIANDRVVEEVKRRINDINIDFIFSAGTLEQLIEDHPFSIFPQMISTERPDRTAAFLIEGRVAIIQDGTPFASIVPVNLFDMLHTPEDQFLRWQFGTFLRIIRIFAVLLAIFLPGLYISLILYHHEMIPSELFSSIAKARESIPFPSIVEITMMEVSWELIREAGVRVPGVIGQTLGIVGGVILGQAAVAAGLVSPILIIIVAITGLGNFAISNFSLAFSIRILRFAFLLLGAVLGFYGVAIGVFIFGGLACSLKSFGVPYISPIAPKTKTVSDTIIREPIWKRNTRPDAIDPKDRSRAGEKVHYRMKKNKERKQ